MNEPRSNPLVVFGDDWGRHVSSLQHVFGPIIASRPVIWINGLGHRLPTLTPKDLRRAWEKATMFLGRTRKSPVPPERQEHQPLAVINPLVLPWHDISTVYRWNIRSLVWSIKATLKRNGLSEPPVIITGSPPSAGVIGRLGEVGAVYFCMDDFLHLEGVSPNMLGPTAKCRF